MLMDGVDFLVGDCDPRRVGRKSLAVSLSDVAAMAARPSAAIVSVALPRNEGLPLAEALYEGLLALAEEFGVRVAGGDTNSWNGPLVINVTVLGDVTDHGLLLRGGAKPGDDILVTGSFGGSLLGRHFDFQPRVREALVLHEQFELHAGIDVSDGLSLDLSRVANESDCGAMVDLDAVPISDAAQQLAAESGDGRTALDRALSDGEDFELILAVPPDEAQRLLHLQPLDVPITRVGQFVAERGLQGVTGDGVTAPLAPRGYQH